MQWFSGKTSSKLSGIVKDVFAGANIWSEMMSEVAGI